MNKLFTIAVTTVFIVTVNAQDDKEAQKLAEKA